MSEHPPSNELTAVAVVERWSGHGEGGEIAKVIIRGGDYGLYHSTPEEIKQARLDAERVNSALALFRQRPFSASDRLHNLCNALSEQADESPFTREEWERVDKQTVELQNRVRQLERELADAREAYLNQSARLIKAESTAPEPSARRDVLTLHGFEIISLVQCLGGEPDCDVSIAHFEAAKDAETGEDMPAGHYAWFTEYPEEGRLYLSTEPPSAHDDGDAIVGPAATAGEVLADLKALEAGSCAVHGQGACICLGARYWMDRAQAAERAAQPPAAEPTHTATMRCPKCAHQANVAIYAGAPIPHTDVLALLEEVELELRHSSVFVRSREKMHPTGLEQYDDLLRRLQVYLQPYSTPTKRTE